MSTIFQIADYIVGQYSGYAGGITPLKLQKLLYYLKAWGVVAGVPVVHENFLKWQYGPVNEDIYKKYKKCGASQIPSPDMKMKTVDHKEFVDFVLESYAPYSALTLSALTHKEDPWVETAPQQVIKESLMKSFYKKQHFANNFPLKPGGPYYPVLTDMYYSFIMDMDLTKAKPPVYPSFEDYKQKTSQAKADIEKAFSPFLKKYSS